MSPFVIKVCGITSLEDVRSAADSGATAIGFNFYHRSPRFVTLLQAHQLALAVPESIAKVGVFVSPTGRELRQAVASASLDVVQIYGSIPAVIPGGARLWRALSVAAGFRLEPADSRVEAYLLDAPSDRHGGSGQTFDWKLATANFPAPIIIAGGLEAANVALAIRTARPWGVDACSRLESTPGRKDAPKVKSFVEAARAAFLEASSAANAGFVKETV